MPVARYTVPSLAAVALALSIGVAGAQQTLSEGDQDFIDQLAHGGYAEVEAGKMATESENQAVARFGQQMVEDHTRMNEELAALAKSKGYEPPTSADLASQAKSTLMNLLPGATFDKQYADMQVNDHQETLELLQNEARTGQDPDLKALAEKAIPIVEQHLTEARQLQTQTSAAAD
jgi:putative membrane protein